MPWNFAKVNGRLAEVFFERRGKNVIFEGYCHVRKSEYKTKREQKWIKEDTEKVRLVYKNGKYEWLNSPEWAMVSTQKIWP